MIPRTARSPLPWLAGIALVVASGCGHPVQRSLEGRWLGDSVENFEDRELSAATGWARGLSFEFSGSSVTVAVPAEEPRTGKYRVASVHEKDVSLAFQSTDGKTQTAAFKLDDEHSIRFMVDKTRAVVLRRER